MKRLLDMGIPATPGGCIGIQVRDQCIGIADAVRQALIQPQPSLQRQALPARKPHPASPGAHGRRLGAVERIGRQRLQPCNNPCQPATPKAPT